MLHRLSLIRGGRIALLCAKEVRTRIISTHEWASVYLKRTALFAAVLGGWSTACAQDLVAPVTVNGDPGGSEIFRVNGGVRAGSGLWAPFVGLRASTLLPQTAGQQQSLMELEALTLNGDRLRTFVNRKANGQYWDTAEWYLGRNVDVTNMFQLVWGTLGSTWNFRIGRGYPASNDLSITYEGKVVIGADPGGAEVFRVGGDVASSGGGRYAQSVYAGWGVNGSQLTANCLEIGGGPSGLGTQPTYIDFHSADAVQSDFSARIIRNPGLNGDLVMHNVGAGDVVFATAQTDRVRIKGTGEIVVGSDPGGSGLLRVSGGADLKGTLRAKEVVVTLNGWSDYVFDPHYELMPLSEVARRIDAHRHLPGVPATVDILRDGLSIGDMQAIHMRKIEELTLYAIQANEDMRISNGRSDRLEQQNAALTRENEGLRKRLERIEALLSIPQ